MMNYRFLLFTICLLLISCEQEKRTEKITVHTESTAKVTLMTLDPGHFHAALVQKTMYEEVSPTVYVYAPKGPEVVDFLNKIDQYNTRENTPTQWKVEKYLGADYVEKMVSEKAGNVMVVAGKNSKKIDYILAAVEAGLNVYADKPLVINPAGFEKLKKAFQVAQEKEVLIYDIMTERFEATTVLQKLLSQEAEVFGTLVDGSTTEPAISKESVHHFFKYVSGKPLVRPAWFFDVNEEGEGIVDVTTHLVDLIQWEAFPNEIIDSSDVKMVAAKRWPTVLTLDEFQKVTGLSAFPNYLQKDVKDGKLYVYCNGEMNYTIKGKTAKVSVVWNYQAPEGTGDTHYSVMRGTKSNLIIKQGAEENFQPTLYIQAIEAANFESALQKVLLSEIAQKMLGIEAQKVDENTWRMIIPQKFKIGHEAHFAQVTENYLKYLAANQLPDWEVPNMITKYFTTIEAYKTASE
ncbi:MAG: putative oxidoreductase C-terminal domain-containing protein [Bacteroidota bacterium]